jgi:aspartate/glutamate racemase
MPPTACAQRRHLRLTCAATERLWAEGCDLVILACNTASAAALKRMQETWVPPDKRVLGVFVPLIEALTERQWGDNSPPREVAVKHVALFATPATVASRAFQRELAFRAIGVDVEAQPCGGVVDAIEQGDEILAEALVRSHVEALKRRMPNPEAAILGCTHYPLMEKSSPMPGAGGQGLFPGQPRCRKPGRLPDPPPRIPRLRQAVEVPDHRRSGLCLEQGDAIPAPEDHVAKSTSPATLTIFCSNIKWTSSSTPPNDLDTLNRRGLDMADAGLVFAGRSHRFQIPEMTMVRTVSDRGLSCGSDGHCNAGRCGA